MKVINAIVQSNNYLISVFFIHRRVITDANYTVGTELSIPLRYKNLLIISLWTLYAVM